MFSRFFIERPVFANVIAIVTMVLGGVALARLPVEQYPPITPPTVRVSATYPGANAQVVANTVAAPLEQQINGVENMLYMSSTSSSDGTYSLTVTFEIGTNLDDAQILVQNRVASALRFLPEDVQRQGINIRKQATNIILLLSLTSPNDDYDSLFLANYANLAVRDELSRVRGVGDVNVFGTGVYSMRIWIDPERLRSRQLTTDDVMRVVREQNVQVAAGQIGQPPLNSATQFQYTVSVLGRLEEAEQFADIILKTGADGAVTRLRDVARVELGAQSYDQFNLKRGKPTANLGVYQLPGANALDVARDVKQAMDRMAKSFPPGMTYVVSLDTSRFVEASIHDVYWTLGEAGALVLVVILVFLQDWRAVLIPATTVPVTIIGAFAAMAVIGFTVNILTLFGLILAIGIVVDDAIVIVENAAHHIERGEEPKRATIRAMPEVIAPIIGITLVLMAVFLPSAFLGGITGQLYRQFALTIAATALISAINALTLKPAQCALWLRPVQGRRWWFFRAFNAVYGLVERAYGRAVEFVLRHSWPVLAVFAALLALTGWWYGRLPTGFLPVEDQGYLIVSVQLPDAASQTRTKEVMRKIDGVLADTPGVNDWNTIGGMSFIDQSSAPNVGTLFVTLDPWDERLRAGHTLDDVLDNLRRKFGAIQEARIMPSAPPAIRGLGVRTGFQLQLEDRGDAGLQELGLVAQQVIDSANGQTALTAMNTSYRPGVPQLLVDIDRTKVKSLGVSLDAVFSTLQANLGSAYVNDFNKFGRTFQVRVQAEPKYRTNPEDISRLEVRNARGEMLPLGTLASIERRVGPQIINRYNMYPSAAITGEPAPGYSSGDALRLMEQISQRDLPPAMGFEWTGMAYQEQRVSGESLVILGMAMLLVYLVLAAQYESWWAPVSVILVVPLGLLGSIAAVAIAGLDNNVYTQIGMVLIVALASKNAILIVEFARAKRESGQAILAAAVAASVQRLRPILMTSFAFILGVVPLVVAQGAGAAGQRALGTAVFGGMIAATVFSVFFVPVFFVFLQRWEEHRSGGPVHREPSLADELPILENSPVPV
ncbi:MAG: multidrug efflux RND transporter permease subunit [Pirellulales bacterium]|nr:multidrug efflux RND transporter permease subunit [Pirellulales bacterium]